MRSAISRICDHGCQIPQNRCLDLIGCKKGKLRHNQLRLSQKKREAFTNYSFILFLPHNHYFEGGKEYMYNI